METPSLWDKKVEGTKIETELKEDDLRRSTYKDTIYTYKEYYFIYNF
jgi:hypothetical protein